MTTSSVTSTVTNIVTKSGENPLNKLFSKHLDAEIFVNGLDDLTSSTFSITNQNTVFLCLEPALHNFLNSILKNLSHISKISGSCAISFELANKPSFNLTAESLENYASFLALELQPFLQTKAQRLLDIVLVGQQFSAILASYTTSLYNQHFAGAVSVSGSYYWKPQTEAKWEWLTNWFIEKGNCASPMCLLSSVNETLEPPRNIPTGRMANNNLYNVLRAKGCNVMYKEYSSVPPSHDFLAELQFGCEWLLDQIDTTP